MPSIVTELTTYLKTKSAITAKVGSGVNARIYEDYAKQAAKLPYIVVQLFAGTSAEHLNGISGIATARIQVSAYDSTAAKAHELAELIRLAPLQMYRGLMGATFVRVSSTGSSDSGSRPPVKGSDKRRDWTSRDYMFTYNEPTS